MPGHHSANGIVGHVFAAELFGVDELELAADDGAHGDGGFEAPPAEVLRGDVLGVADVREEQAEVGGGDAEDGLGVARVGSLRVIDECLDDTAVGQGFAAQAVHDLAEIFGVEGPAIGVVGGGHARDVDAADEAVETIEQGGFVEDGGKVAEPIDVGALALDVDVA